MLKRTLNLFENILDGGADKRAKFRWGIVALTHVVRYNDGAWFCQHIFTLILDTYCEDLSNDVYT